MTRIRLRPGKGDAIVGKAVIINVRTRSPNHFPLCYYGNKHVSAKLFATYRKKRTTTDSNIIQLLRYASQNVRATTTHNNDSNSNNNNDNILVSTTKRPLTVCRFSSTPK